MQWNRERGENRQEKNWAKRERRKGSLSMGVLETCVKPGALTARFKQGEERAAGWSQISTSYSEDWSPILLLLHQFGHLWHHFTLLFVGVSAVIYSQGHCCGEALLSQPNILHLKLTSVNSQIQILVQSPGMPQMRKCDGYVTKKWAVQWMIVLVPAFKFDMEKLMFIHTEMKAAKVNWVTEM